MRVIIHFSQNNATQRSAAQWIRRLPCLERRRSGAQRCEQLIWFLHSVCACARFGRSERFAQSLRPLRSLAPAASLPRSGRSARSLRALVSLAAGAELGRFGRFARSRDGPWLRVSCCSLAPLARSTRPCSPGPSRSLAPHPPLARLAPSAPSLRGLRSVAPRPLLGRSAAFAPSLSALRALRSLVELFSGHAAQRSVTYYMGLQKA